MKTRNEEHAVWEDCYPGDIGQVVSRLQSQRRTRETVRGGMVLGTIVVLIAVGIFSRGTMVSMDANFGGVSCRDVSRLTDSLLAGTLDAETAEKIRQHLARCEGCRKRLQQMKQGRDTPTNTDRPSLLGNGSTRNIAGRGGFPWDSVLVSSR